MSNDSEYHWIHTPPVFMLQIEALWHNMQQAKVMLEICPSPTEFEFFKLSWVPRERLNENIVYLNLVHRVEQWSRQSILLWKEAIYSRLMKTKEGRGKSGN